MKFLIAKKIGMSQVFDGDVVVPVTTIDASPCTVTQVKTEKIDGYSAVQIGCGSVRHATKPLRGHSKGKGPFRFLREFRLPSDVVTKEGAMKIGDVLTVEQFVPGDVVTVVGNAKGRGFAGVVKRHHFHGHPKTHGHKDQLRMPGSIGAGGVQHVFKGRRMAGRMGGNRVTVKHCTIVQIDQATHHLLLKGAVPGARNGLLLLRSEK